MSGDPTKAAIWPDADVYIAPLGTEVPTTADAFGAGWELVGLLDGEAGFVHSREEEVEDHYAWGGILVRTSRRNYKQSVAFTALEDNETTRALAWPDSAEGEIVVPRPTRLLVAFDLSEDTTRKRLVTAYQAEVSLNADVTDAEGDLTRYEFMVTVFPDADGVLFFDQHGVPAISESFDKPDSPTLGPDLSWRRRVFIHEFPWEVEGQEVRQYVDVNGTYEMLQVPTPNITSPDHGASVEITDIQRGLGFAVGGDYVMDFGAIVRYKDRADESQPSGVNYRGYAAGAGRNNVFLAPGHTWHCAIFTIDGVGDAVLLDIAITSSADVVLPGTFTLEADGPNITATLTHSGPGGPLVASGVDSTWTDGMVAMGGSIQIDAIGDTGLLTADNFTAYNL